MCKLVLKFIKNILTVQDFPPQRIKVVGLKLKKYKKNCKFGSSWDRFEFKN